MVKMLIAAFLLSVPAGLAHAQLSIGVKGGSTGVGGEINTSLSKKFNARVSATFFNYTHSGVYADDEPSIAYNMEGNMTSIGAVVDFFPANRGLKMSVGLFYHDFLVNGDASPNESYEISGKTFSPERLGSLTADVTYDSKIVPYAGIGLGNPVAMRGSKIKLNFEVGAMYTNSPSVTMEGEGMIAPTANYGPQFEEGAKDFKFYPVINLGISFRLK